MSFLMTWVTERDAVAEFVSKVWIIPPTLDVVRMKSLGCTALAALPTIAVLDRLHPHLALVSVPLWVFGGYAALPVRIIRADELALLGGAHLVANRFCIIALVARG